MEALIEVGYREGVFDANGGGIKKDVVDLDIKGVREVRTHQLYLLEGKISAEGARFISENILCDPVTQYYKLLQRADSGKANGSNGHYAVEVWFKKGVTDNVGTSVKKAIDDLEIKGVAAVRSGRKFILEGKLTKSEAINITTRLLANEVVEEYRIYGEQ